MFLIQLKNLFKKKQRESSLIRGFDEALDWIKTYEKAHDYNQAILAIRELILKHKTAVTFYEETVRKLFVLESSNVREVSLDAKEKIQKVNDFLEILYYRITILERRLKNAEEFKQKEIEARQTVQQKKILQTQMDEVQALVSKKEYTKALGFAKKIVFDNQHDKAAFKLLMKVQKLYDGHKKNIEKEEKQKERVDKTLKELGIEDNTEEQKIIKKTVLSPVFEYLRTIGKKRGAKQDYLRRQSTLQSMEKLLLRSGSIDNVSAIDMRDEELFSVINSGLTKDVGDFNMLGFDFFGRIMGKDKIIGDTFGYYKTDDNRVIFYFGDATGHGVQAGFTVAVFSKLFFDLSKKTKNVAELFMLLNNGLKERIKGKSFITAILFEWDSRKNTLRFIGAGHDPLFLYRRGSGQVEKIIPGGLALGVRPINNPASVKIRDIEMANEDVLFGYTDGVIEARNVEGKMFGLELLEKTFKKSANNFTNPAKVYESLFREVGQFQEGRVFDDDASAFIFVRNTSRDLIENEAELQALLKEANMKKLQGDFSPKNKTKQEVMEQIKKQNYERDVKIRLDRLERLHKIGEYIKLKQEVILYYREGFVHDKMKFYLEKAIENEYHTTVRKQEEKLARKYETLNDLYKKGEYEIVVKEALDVIFKNGKI